MSRPWSRERVLEGLGIAASSLAIGALVAVLLSDPRLPWTASGLSESRALTGKPVLEAVDVVWDPPWDPVVRFNALDGGVFSDVLVELPRAVVLDERPGRWALLVQVDGDFLLGVRLGSLEVVLAEGVELEGAP